MNFIKKQLLTILFALMAQITPGTHAHDPSTSAGQAASRIYGSTSYLEEAAKKDNHDHTTTPHPPANVCASASQGVNH